jgi:uncharacterized protein YbjT (DUF2867 family)
VEVIHAPYDRRGAAGHQPAYAKTRGGLIKGFHLIRKRASAIANHTDLFGGNMVKKKIVVAGAVGVIGRTIVSHFEKLDDWEVVGLSRTKPDFPTKMQHISVDLLDEAGSRKILSGIGDVSHIVFAALQWTPDLAAQVAPNRALVVNLVNGIEAGSAKTLKHVTLMQGKRSTAHAAEFLLCSGGFPA